uniref:Uncharacterized protein n=1 Tax=Salix viminalis TaxID=40686 RepID=A0A6N2N9V1_SALVM
MLLKVIMTGVFLIKAFDKIKRVGCEFNGDCTSTSIPFKSLECLTFERMLQWCEWIPDAAKSDQDRSFIASKCHCFSLPPIGQLTCLKRLHIKAFDKVERVGYEFYGDCTSTSIPFKSRESLTFERMLQWCEWIPDAAKSDQDRSFPSLQVLCISECPKLKGTLLSHLRSLKAHDYRIFPVCAFTSKTYNYQ